MAEAPTTLAQAHNSTKALAAQAKLRATMSRPLQRGGSRHSGVRETYTLGDNITLADAPIASARAAAPR
jgi:hypothetical protein